MKRGRVVAGAIFFAVYLLVFLQAFEGIPLVADAFPKLQIFPGILRFIAAFSVSSLIVLLLCGVAVFFGRWYCSVICPFGVFQDIFIFIRSFFLRRRRFRFHKGPLAGHGALFIASIALFAAGYVIVLAWIEPYSVFGRLTVNLIRPVVTPVVNALSFALYHRGITIFDPMTLYDPGIAAILYSVLFVFFVALLSFLRGRLFCNLLCPTGFILRLCARFSFFGFRIKRDTCTRCGLCESVCRAECIESKSGYIDTSRCVSCADCRAVCPENAIVYGTRSAGTRESVSDQGNAETRGEFLGRVGKASFLLLPLFFSKPGLAAVYSRFLPFKKNEPVMPPGAQSRKLFNSRCTSCNLCVEVCPNQIIRPSVGEYGVSSFMQPRLDYDVGYCLFECTRCTEVCPTGALLRLKKNEKEMTQIGKAILLKENCIVYQKDLPCTACTEHCPTKAVDAFPYRNGLMAPEVEDAACIGCGACEHACPVVPKAIYVEGNIIQSSAKKKTKFPPKTSTLKEKSDKEDFPF